MSNENSTPEQKDKCAHCDKLVTKRFVKFHEAGSEGEKKKRRKYSDETGRLWHGKRCPDCAVQWRKDVAAEKAQAKKDQLKEMLGE